MVTAQQFLSVTNELGEGSFWSADEQRLYWLDIKRKRYYKMDITNKQYDVVDVGAEIGVMALKERGGLVMATDKGFVSWDTETRKMTSIDNPLQGQANRRFNDGNIDVKGRFWAGDMCDPPEVCKTPQCNLYKLDPDGTVTIMDRGLGMPNGLVWSLDNRTMYLTDSPQQVIYAYDFDPESGTIENRRPFVQTHDLPGVPDGLTIDAEGFLWSLRYYGGRVIRYDPDGKIEREVLVPVPHTSSCTFAGPDLTDLFITTAWDGLNDAQRKQYSQSGDLFWLKTDIKGTVRRKFAG
jgi:sugar lactone lactonase YvrE